MKKLSSTVYKLSLPILFALLAVESQAQVTKVVNAASFVRHASLTPGSIVTIFGSKLSNATAFASDGAALPLTLAEVSVSVAEMPLKLFYASPRQINGRLDPATPLGPQTLKVTSPAGVYTFDVTVEKSGWPGLFSLSGSGTRDGAILNAMTYDRGPFSVTTDGSPTYLAIYATGLDLSQAPEVSIGGVSVPVQYYGDAPGFPGLQQINVQLVEELAGAGRVEIAVLAGGKVSNVVETVILPKRGQGKFAPKQENQKRNRELAEIAWIPDTSLALLTDENDDVVRVLDVQARAVVRTIALPERAQPTAIAVNETGTLAVVAERDRGKAAILDLTTWTVAAEVETGGGPGDVAIASGLAVVVNQDSDSVTVIELATGVATATIPVGRGPRSIAIEGMLAYVTNQADGTVSVIDLTAQSVTATYELGENTRPHAIRLLPQTSLAVVTDATALQRGNVLLMDVTTGEVVNTLDLEKAGGATDVAIAGGSVYIANRCGGSVTIATLAPAATTPSLKTITVKVDVGARALAVDELDSMLLVTNQGSGTVVLIDLATNEIAGRIEAVRSELEQDEEDIDDREDREEADNAPAVMAVAPASAAAGSAFTLRIAGSNLKGVTGVAFLKPSAKGWMQAAPDGGFTVEGLAINEAGTEATATVTIAAGVAAGERTVRVFGANGESKLKPSAANTFRVE